MNTANLIFTATYAKTGKRSGYFYELKPIDDTNNKTSNSDKYLAYKAMKLFHNDKTIKLIDNERYNIEVAINPLEIKKLHLLIKLTLNIHQPKQSAKTPLLRVIYARKKTLFQIVKTLNLVF
ncbi:hypothetical protein Bcop_1774 [Bacteroides coprosuis DSM 18011]|uniref:Uncharacterized protein n=1 Tax=Bacteroides coprosuis DSM 18011 TaxID=679937 RepID=F3ZRF6_9BACE|nr:hypothetical protein [Bacteroides coprosuis]EGJ71964.1 hypothetical protein Bcop_1774 [Bacteroides coprosuis DSM 18011]